MIILGPTATGVHLSLNEFNEDLGIGTRRGLDRFSYHYVFRITNQLTKYTTTFTPFTNATYLGGDKWWNTIRGLRENEFLFTVSPTYSFATSGGIYITGSNYDNNSEWNLEVYVNPGSYSTGTPSISGSSILLNQYRTIFKYI